MAMDEYVKKIWKESFKGFYKKHSRSLWFFIYKTCGDESMADDIFQESFYKYLRAEPVKLNQYQRKAFLFKIAYRLIIDQVRKIKFQQEKSIEMAANPEAGIEAGKEREISTALDMEKPLNFWRQRRELSFGLPMPKGTATRRLRRLPVQRKKASR